MADAVFVFLDPMSMPSPQAWADALAGNGFDMQMDAGFEPRTTPGVVSCVFRGKPAAFVYGYEVLDGASVGQQGLGDPSRRLRVTLRSRSDEPQCISALVAGGVLCAIADGILLDPGTGELIRSADAISWARRQEAQWLRNAGGQGFHAASNDESAGAAPPSNRPRPEALRARKTRTEMPPDPTWKGVFVNLAVAYAVAIILTTYRAPPNDLSALMLGPLVLVAISAIFGLAAARIVRLRKSLDRRFRPKFVWLVSTWFALLLSLIDPFLPAPPIQSNGMHAPADELRRGVLGK